MTENATSKTKKWQGDVLNRQATADYLTKYLTNRYHAKKGDKGFVIAVNADWGYGKTFMLEKWRDDLIELDYPAMYFDAWQNDFTPEPLIAFIAELEKAMKPLFKEVPEAKKIMRRMVDKANALWKPATGMALEILAKKAFSMGFDELRERLDDSEGLADIGNEAKSSGAKEPSSEEIFKALSKIYDSTLKDHQSKSSAIKAFRQNLEMLITELEKHSKYQLPIFIFVDELDRCRPDYAIELLEGIKHLFGVPGIYFVVATNMRQLGESTKAVYGSGFNGQQYLKRFFDLEFSLPLPDTDSFAQSLFNQVSLPIDENIVSGAEYLYKESKDIGMVPYIFARYIDYFDLGLRDQQQVIKIIEAAFLSIEGKIHIHYLFFLAMLYHKSSEVFEHTVKNRTLENNHAFTKLVTESQKVGGVFTVRERSHPYERNIATKRISPAQIAKVYLENAWKNATDIRDKNHSNEAFPGNLLSPIGYEVPSHYYTNREYVPSIWHYPDIIRNAGGFVQKPKKEDQSNK